MGVGVAVVVDAVAEARADGSGRVLGGSTTASGSPPCAVVGCFGEGDVGTTGLGRNGTGGGCAAADGAVADIFSGGEVDVEKSKNGVKPSAVAA